MLFPDLPPIHRYQLSSLTKINERQGLPPIKFIVLLNFLGDVVSGFYMSFHIEPKRFHLKKVRNYPCPHLTDDTKLCVCLPICYSCSIWCTFCICVRLVTTVMLQIHQTIDSTVKNDVEFVTSTNLFCSFMQYF